MAHWIERAFESGQVASYGEVAGALGLTDSRITQVTALLGLAHAVQKAGASVAQGWQNAGQRV